VKPGELRGACVYPQEASAKIDNALIALGEDCGLNFVQTVTASRDNAGDPRNG